MNRRKQSFRCLIFTADKKRINRCCICHQLDVEEIIYVILQTIIKNEEVFPEIVLLNFYCLLVESFSGLFHEFSTNDIVKTYLFNSKCVTKENNKNSFHGEREYCSYLMFFYIQNFKLYKKVGYIMNCSEENCSIFVIIRKLLD